ncbi:MAG TPA: c-type cytochrome [Planctomycetota bacterium]|jgi:mono/diheme cytochrome c family protein|nr:c-type cytochrome [Planctomycetota bacterium]
MTAPSPVPPAKLPGKALLGLGISALLLFTAIALEIYNHSMRQGITVRTVADPAQEPLLQPVAPGSRLPSQAELNPAPNAAPAATLSRPGGMPPGHPGSGVAPRPAGAPGDDSGEAPPETVESLVRDGRALAIRLKCITCHSEDGKPASSSSFFKLYGKQSLLKDGTQVTVDEAYIRESILEPQAKVVAGPTVVMPSFKGVVSEHDLRALVAYIKALQGTANPNEK